MMWQSAKGMHFFGVSVVFLLMLFSAVNGQTTYPLQMVVWPGGGFENVMQVNDTQFQSFKQRVCSSGQDLCAEMWASIFKGADLTGTRENVVTLDDGLATSGTTMYYSCKQFATSADSAFKIGCCPGFTYIDLCQLDSDCSQLPAVKCQNGKTVMLTWSPEQNARILKYDQNEMEVLSCCSSNATTITTSTELPTTTMPKTPTESSTSAETDTTNTPPSTSKETTPSSNTTPATDDKPNILVFVGIGIGVALASVIATSVVCVLLRIKRKRNREKSDSNTFMGKSITSTKTNQQVLHEYVTPSHSMNRISTGSLPVDDYDYIGIDAHFVDDGYERIHHAKLNGAPKPSDVTENEKEQSDEVKNNADVEAEYIIPIEPPYFERLDERCVDDDNDYLTPVVPSNHDLESRPTLPPRPHTAESKK